MKWERNRIRTRESQSEGEKGSGTNDKTERVGEKAKRYLKSRSYYYDYSLPRVQSVSKLHS